MRRRSLSLVASALLVGGLLIGPGAGPVAADDPTVPDPSQTGPVRTYDASLMQPNSQGDNRCSGVLAGWEPVDPANTATYTNRLEGEVVIGHPPHGDAFFNHHTEDYNFFVVPDDHNPIASDPSVDYGYLLAEGNFQTGEPKEHGRIEVENEYGALPWNDAAGSGYYGLPTWAWPATGDRAIVDGYWIYDCGHHDPGYRSEIHPAWMVVALRNMMQSQIARGSSREGWVAPLGLDDASYSRVTKADVWISSFGGEAVEDEFTELGPNGEDWWQPVNSRDYDFNIPAPPKPNPDAVLKMQIQEPPGTYWRPPGAVGPAFDLSNMTPFERDGKTFVHVHVPFKSVATSKYLLFAKSLIVGWDVPAPDVQHLRITINRWNVFDDVADGEINVEYSPWAQSGDQNTFVTVSDGADGSEQTEFDCDSDGNYMPYCDVEEENNYVQGGTSFDRFINGHDPLIVQFRAKESDYPAENNDAGFASQAFTAADNWGIGTHTVYQSDNTFAGEYDDFESSTLFSNDVNSCDGNGPDDHPNACYAVTYTIERITDPTTTTISAPTVQYATDPNLFTAKVVTPGSPDKPRRLLPVTFTFTDGTNTQVLNGVTGDDGVAAPTDVLTLPAGTYSLTTSFAGNGLLTASSDSRSVTIEHDPTVTKLTLAPKIRWGHQDPMTVALVESKDPRLTEFPVPGKNLTITLTGTLGTQAYPVGPTAADGTATITPLMTLPPGNYTATACFAQDAWFAGSCSAGQAVKVTFGFASFARGGPINFSGGANKATGDLHSEGSVLISGNSHVLSAGPGERFEYVTTFTDIGTGNAYNKFQVSALGITPSYLRSTYCTGASSFMGVPITYSSTSLTFKNDQVISGIYCVTGDIKIQSRVSGKVVLLATGLITTSGGGEKLETADPTGADVLMLAGSTNVKAISIQATDSTHKGVLVAAGGVYISSKNSIFDTGLLGTQVLVSGTNNLLKAPQ